MVGSDSPPDVGGPSHFARTTYTRPNNFEAFVRFEFPLQRWSLVVKPQQPLTTEHEMQKCFNSSLQ